MLKIFLEVILLNMETQTLMVLYFETYLLVVVCLFVLFCLFCFVLFCLFCFVLFCLFCFLFSWGASKLKINFAMERRHLESRGAFWGPIPE